VPPLQEDYLGPAAIETFTVLYHRDGSPGPAAIVGRSAGGSRFLAKIPSEDSAAIQWLTSGTQEPVGATGTAFKGADGDTWWRMN
jgi:acetyl-CoA C-acetyltransferase